MYSAGHWFFSVSPTGNYYFLWFGHIKVNELVLTPYHLQQLRAMALYPEGEISSTVSSENFTGDVVVYRSATVCVRDSKGGMKGNSPEQNQC